MADTELIPTTPEAETAFLSGTPGLREAFLASLTQIPEPSGDAYDRIIAQVMAAESVGELDAPWSNKGLDFLVDATIRVDDIRRMPSDFVDGIGHYLLLDVTLPNDGSKCVVSTGSVNVCAQLVRAYVLGLFPLTVIPRRARKATAAGYFPMHLEIVRR